MDTLETRMGSATAVAAVMATDSELLQEFIETHSEYAFEQLVRRHGPIVFNVCYRVLAHRQDAEDAAQATFLVPAKKANSLTSQPLAGWLSPRGSLATPCVRSVRGSRGRRTKRGRRGRRR